MQHPQITPDLTPIDQQQRWNLTHPLSGELISFASFDVASFYHQLVLDVAEAIAERKHRRGET